MAKWYGKIGYGVQKEVKPGVWKNEITERSYYGDVIRNTRKLQTASQVNDNITVSNEISILADPYANKHFYEMIYAEFAGVKWKITNVDIQYPRLTLSLGEVYTNG